MSDAHSTRCSATRQVAPGLEQNLASDRGCGAAAALNYNPFLRMAELPKLLQRLRKYRGLLQTQLGLWLLLFIKVRTGELRLATPDQFDLDRGLWIIPPEVVKQLQVDMRRAPVAQGHSTLHRAVSSAVAIEIVAAPYSKQPNQRAPFQPLCHDRLEPKKRMERTRPNGARCYGPSRPVDRARYPGHDVRTALNEIGYPVDAQPRTSIPTRLRATYNHAEQCRAAAADDAGLYRTGSTSSSRTGRGSEHAAHHSSEGVPVPR